MIFRCFVLSLLFLNPFSYAEEFSFHLNEEPAHLNPYKLDKLSGQYVLTNLFQGYFNIDKDLNLKPGLAKKCVWKTNTHLVCTMGKNYWSKGQLIPLHAYLNSLKYHLKHHPESFVSQVLVGLKDNNALKIEAPDKLHIMLKKPDADFLYRLSVPSFSPLPAGIIDSEIIGRDYATGPYKLKKWNRGRNLELTRNEQFPVKVKNPPTVNVYFVFEDNTALAMYESKQLKLLRRLPPEVERRFKNSTELQYVHYLRFDYLGFGPSLKDKKTLRKSLAEGLNYPEFQKIFQSLKPPGCFGLPAKLSSFSRCHELSQPEKKLTDDVSLKLYFSGQGGENLTRSVQWYQNQWKKNLGLNIRIIPEDTKALGYRLQSKPPDIFRRGVPMDRPSCLAALEIFESESLDNFVKFKSKKYDELVRQLRENPSLDPLSKISKCTEALAILFKSYMIIPLGEYHIPMLSDPRFQGWSINGLNQMDLTQLHYVSK